MKTMLVLLLLLIRTVFTYAGNITGVVRYANDDTTAMRAAKVLLLNQAGTIIDSAITAPDGSFSFPNLPDGVYLLRAKPAHPWGGVNSSDALLTLKHFVGMQLLAPFYAAAADVNADTYVNSMDALYIAKRFTLQVFTFPAGDWISFSGSINIAGPSAIQITVYALCYGDVNGSYLPLNDQFLLCGDTLTDSRDGKKYNTVLIDHQCWLRQNMNIGIMLPGTGNQANNGIFEKYCYNDDTLMCNLYGGLYQWTEMMQYVTSAGTQGICPAGFHIPSLSEWDTMVSLLGGETVAGGPMKETGYVYWDTPNTGATNQSGFSARGGGNRIGSGTFLNLNTEAKIWSSTQQNINSAWYRNLYNINTSALSNNHGKNNGLSVRCLKVIQ